jgi:hypothetical protein
MAQAKKEIYQIPSSSLGFKIIGYILTSLKVVSSENYVGSTVLSFNVFL